MSLLDAPSFKNVSRPLNSTALPSEAYALSIASLSSCYAVSASAPNNAIYLYDRANLRNITTLRGHEVSITHMRAVPAFVGSAGPILISCGKDGTVKAWDERTASVGLQMHALTSGRTPGLLSCDVSVNGMMVAAGTELQGDDASILYWDPRQPAAPLRTHSYTHSDDITALHFCRPSSGAPAAGNVLLSASSDGLVCTSNADEEDEDEAGLHVGNWGCSIAQAGWISGRMDLPGIWAASDMETFSVWSNELDLVQNVDIRQPSVHRQDLTWVTDYLIGCHNNMTIPSDADNDLSVFVGSNEGDIALISRSTLSDPSWPWTLSQIWSRGHAGVVRSLLWDEQNNVLITGGEDSKINAWSGPTLGAQSASNELGSKRDNDDQVMDVDEEMPIRKRRRA
ncbi:WD40 repeat-like protein [Obba rivulosa]|uniref:WD40 repeat-like protein n=1 Tax=Obba rivulosa TaxID=1052685 RepID=A0A8E2DUP5_9APHY|nr:WD40 repeat-like protein [Obba rivulosa]